MTPKQEDHLQQILKDTTDGIATKYRKGQEEHGGDLFEKSPEQLIDEALNEVYDQAVYLQTLKQALHARNRGTTSPSADIPSGK